MFKDIGEFLIMNENLIVEIPKIVGLSLSLCF